MAVIGALTSLKNSDTMYSMETAKATAAAYIERKGSSDKRSIFSWIAWLYDRFVFWVVHRGRRIRPEVGEALRKDVEDANNGKNVSPEFTTVEEAIKWLRS